MMHARRFLLLLAVAPFLSCGTPFDTGGGRPEAVTVEASVDGLTITVTWTAAAHAYDYRVELFEHPPGRGLVGEIGTGRKRRTQITDRNDWVRANNTYTVTVFSRNSYGRTRSTNSPTVKT